jgi:lambda repressor-like predicted transcriptional regulator
MSTLKDRLHEVLSDWKRKAGASARGLSEAAGLNSSHLGVIFLKEDPKVQTDVIEAIAKAAGVSPAWLAYGYGTKGDAFSVPGELSEAIRVGARWSTPVQWAVIGLHAANPSVRRTVGEWAETLDRMALALARIWADDAADRGSTKRLKV